MKQTIPEILKPKKKKKKETNHRKQILTSTVLLYRISKTQKKSSISSLKALCKSFSKPKEKTYEKKNLPSEIILKFPKKKKSPLTDTATPFIAPSTQDFIFKRTAMMKSSYDSSSFLESGMDSQNPFSFVILCECAVMRMQNVNNVSDKFGCKMCV